MSYSDEYFELRKKKKKEEATGEHSEEATGHSFTDKYNNLRAQAQETAVNDIAPVLFTSAMRQTEANLTEMLRKEEELRRQLEEQRKKEEGLDLFQKGAFEDGYQFGDVVKSILGTTGDAGLGVVKGIAGLGEGLGDLASYGVAGVADLFGADDYADQVRRNAQVNLIEETTRDADDYLDKYSVLGRTTDSVVQGVGQVAGIAATGGLGSAAGLSSAGATALTTGVMGLSSMGSGMGEAYQNGATDEEAVAYGAMVGAADAITELIFGGLGKGINALGFSKGLSSADDMLAKAVSSKIKGTLGKNLVEFGIKSSAEGLEEVLAGVAQAAAKKATYMSEEDFADIVKDENLLEQFVVGAVTSSIAQAPGLHTANKTGTDFITGQTQNEQAVVKKEIENRIAEQEKDGKKLTAKEKSAIKSQVEKDLEKGYISTDTIEEVLGGETYQEYKETIDSENALLEEQKALQEEFDALNKMKQGEMTGEQIDRRVELKEELSKLKDKIQSSQNDSPKNDLKQQLSDSVSEMVRGDRLIESYNERSRRGQAFEADLTKYDAKQQTVIQKAIDSGILNNTNRTHEFVDLVAKVSADKGVHFDFTDNEKLKESGFAVDGKFVNGYFDKKSGTIGVNIDSAKAVNTVVGHEITHVLEGTDFYNTLRDTIVEYAKAKGDYQGRIDALNKLYDPDDVDSELVADLVGDYLFTDSDFVRKLSVENKNVFQKIYDEIKYLCKVATAGSKEARELEKVKKAFEDAYRADSKADSKADVKHSLGYHAGDLGKAEGYWNMMSSNRGTGHFGTGTYFVGDEAKIADSHYGNRPHEKVEFDNYHLFKPVLESDGFDLHSALKYINDNIFDYPIAKMSFDEMWDVRKKADEAEYTLWDDDATDAEKSAAQKTLDDFKERFESVGYDPDHMDAQELYEELSDISKEYHLIRSKLEMIFSRDFRKLSYDEQSAKIDSIMQGIYDEVSQIEDAYAAKHEDSPSTRFMKALGYEGIDVRGFKGLDNTTYGSVIYDLKGDNLARKKEIGTAKYSLSDSDGKQLSKEQQEYFKDSKAVDENGNLQVVYHGTRNADFTVFKRNATYFTDSKDMADSYSPNGDMYEGYVNITKPYEIDATGEKWSKIPIDDATKAFLQEYGSSVFKEGGKWRTTPADIVEAIEEAVENGDMDYDGIIIRNVDDTGSYYKDSDKHLATDYIVFNSNQFKNADNTSPTADPDIRFSLSESVEETKDLIALHNMQSSELIKTLELGGLPMPSVAIIKAEAGHEQYGDVSLILPKETIDPKASRNNKIYGGDAWTPTYPKIEYKPNEKVAKRIRDKYYGLANKIGYDAVRPMYSYVNELEDTLNRSRGEATMLEQLYEDTDMMNVYLQDSGKGKVEPIIKETVTEISDIEAEMNQFFIDALGKDLIAEFKVPEGQSPITYRKDYMQQHESEIRNAYKRYFTEVHDFTAEEADNALSNTAMRDLMKIVRGAYQYAQNSGVSIRTETDHEATRDAIRNAAEDGYRDWVDSLFKGVEEKSGIRNNQDYYTRSGNPRSWDALHWENTLENVVKVMRQQTEKGADTFFGGTGIWAVSAKDYSSIEEVKADSHRLRKMSEEEYEAVKDSYAQRFNKIAENIADKSERNWFIAQDNAMEAIVDAVRTSKTKAGILNELKQYRQLNVTEADVDDIVSLVSDIAEMPTGYFEAKPRRAVGLDEVGVFVIPRNADVKLKQELLNRGYSIAEYDPDVEGDRQKVVNQFEEYKFSLSNVGETPKQYGKYNVYGKDVALQEEVAPVATPKITEETAKTEQNVPIVEEQDLFPDNLAPVEAELDNLYQQKETLESRMLEAVNAEDMDTFTNTNTEYESVMARIEELENEISATESDRVNSLDDADVPPEIVRQYDTQEDITPIAKKDIADIAREAKSTLGVKSQQMGDFRRLIEEYSNSESPSREQLFKSIKENFGTYTERVFDQTIADAKKYLRSIKLYVSDTIRGDIADFADFKKRNRGKIILSANGGLPVDSAYQELNGLYPQLFPEDIINPTDQVLQMVDVANMSSTTRFEHPIDDNTLWEVANDIADDVAGMKRLQQEADANKYSSEAFDSLMQDVDRYAPLAEDVTPVIEESPVAPVTNEAPVAEKYEAIIPKPTKEPRLARATPEEQAQNSKVAKILFDHQQTPKQKSAWKWAREHIFSRGAVFEDMSLKTGNRELQAKFDNIRRAESMAQTFMGKGKGNAKALVDVRKAVEKSGKTEDFNYYLYHLHNIDRMTLEQRFKDVPNKSVFGDSVDAEVSRKAALGLEVLNPEFKQWADDVYAINRHLRQMMVDEGVISQETADLWQEMYPHYVPISRADSSGLNVNVPLDTKRTGINAPIKKATGGNSDFYNVFDTMGSRIEQTYKAIAKNRFGVELMDTLGTAYESDVADIDTVLETMDQHEELLQGGKNGESPSFTVFQNGKRVKFAITEDMYDAMKPSQFTYTNEALKKINDIRRDILTTYSPTFALTNPIKDVQDILMNSQHPVRTYATVPEAIYSVISKNHWYQERMENGGDQDSYFDGQTKTFKKEGGWFKKAMGFVPSKIQAANELIEQVPRMAEYIASRKMGRSIDVSMLDAARVTTNFGATGDLTNMLNRNGFTFLGASVEGFNQQVRNVREAKAEGLKGWAKLAGKYLVAGLPALLLNHALWDDDEEYEELSDYVKQNYYVVAKTEDGKFIRIPKGRAVAVIQDAFKQMENLITGNDEVDLDSFGQLVMNNLAPNNPLENNLIAPIIQATTNKTWYGDDLVPTRLQDVPVAEQFDETTDSISRWLGEATDTSPYKWNYLLDQYTGGVGDMVLPYLTPEADGGGMGAAFRDKLVSDPVLKNQNVSDFYNKVDELTVNANSSKATDEDVLMSKYMSAVSSEMGDLYKQKREIQNSDLADDEKYEQVREIQQQIDSIAKESLATYEDVNINGIYATVGDKHYRWYEPGEDSEAEPGWQKLTDKQLKKQEDVTSGLGISASEYWSNKEEYDFAYENPEKYAVAKSVGGYSAYRNYSSELYDIKADKDENGKSINGSRKEKVLDYINNLDADYGEKIILFKSEYNADDTYNYDIIEYLNGREDISYKEMETILKELGFTVDSNGNITWD